MLREGAFADLVVFDGSAVQDTGSVAAPASHPRGFAQVLVNGCVVLRDGQRNDERPGRVLRAGR